MSVYSEGAYESGDLDFVTCERTLAELFKVLESIGFSRQGMSFVHPRCRQLFVQIISDPLGIGDDLSIRPTAKSQAFDLQKVFCRKIKRRVNSRMCMTLLNRVGRI